MFQLCYFCGAPATSTEHVPPACLFPEKKDLDDGVDYRKSLITVPSCDAHNSHKCKDDEYLQLILVHGYFNNKAGRDHFNSKIVRALTRRPAILAALYANQTPVTVDYKHTMAVDVDRERLNRTLVHVCQGLCYHHTGNSWPKEIEIHTPILLSMDGPDADRINTLVTSMSKVVLDCLKNAEKFGENQDIFWYQLRIDEAKDRLLCRMVFYGGFDVFAVSHPRLRGEIGV